MARYLRDLGLDVDEDEAGSKVGSTIGNLYCRVEPHGDGAGTPLFRDFVSAALARARERGTIALAAAR